MTKMAELIKEIYADGSYKKYEYELMEIRLK